MDGGSAAISLRAADLDSGLSGMDDFNASMDAQAALSPSPLASLANAFVPTPDMGGQTPAQPAQNQDQMRDLKQQFTALTTTSAIWNPTAKLNNDQVAKGVETNRAEATAKTDTATQKMDSVREQAADLTKRMDALDSGNAGADAGAQQPGGLGGLVMGEMKGAAVTAAVTVVNPAAGAALAAVQMVAMMGRGSFGVMNQGEFASARVDRKGHVVESGYGKSEPAPGTQPNQPAASPAAPTSQSMLNQMGRGPGFGRVNAMMDMDEGRVGLSGDGLRDVSRINIEQTPAMKAYESMRLDGVNVSKLHEARQQNGVAADADNVAKAAALGMDDPAMRGQTMRMSGAMM